MLREERQKKGKQEMENENRQNEAVANPLDFAYARMKEVRTLLGKAGYEIGMAKIACDGVKGTESFVNSLNEVGSKIAYLLGDCIGFCDSQQKRVDDERKAQIAEIQRLTKESEMEKLAEIQRQKEAEDAKNMAIAEDSPLPHASHDTISTAKRGRTRAKAQ